MPATSTPMTIGQWKSQQFIMHWSIYDRNSINGFQAREASYTDEATWRQAFGETLLDFTAPEGTPDGSHTVYHQRSHKTGESHGVIVVDRQFVPHPTQNAVMEAVAKSDGVDPDHLRQGKAVINNIFIEGFEWHPETQRLEVFTGS